MAVTFELSEIAQFSGHFWNYLCLRTYYTFILERPQGEITQSKEQFGGVKGTNSCIVESVALLSRLHS